MSLRRLGIWLRHILGIHASQVSLAEKLVAALGGFIGIILISYISYHMTGAQGAALIVPSMGASAVLLFAVPHGRLSQPWALLGGHVISALTGVACYQYISHTFLAAGLAVGLAIGLMHLLRCLHPPGGATALTAVIGGHTIHELGYGFALNPILINALIIFIVAIVFNSMFPWRRYPASSMRFTSTPAAKRTDKRDVVSLQNIKQAIEDLDIVVDVTLKELQQIILLSHQHAEQSHLQAEQIKLGHYYSNGRHGHEYAIRQIIDESSSDQTDKDMVIYQVVEGHGLRNADSCTRSEFADWAALEVFPNKAKDQ